MSYNSACRELLRSLLFTLYIHSLCASRRAELACGQQCWAVLYVSSTSILNFIIIDQQKLCEFPTFIYNLMSNFEINLLSYFNFSQCMFWIIEFATTLSKMGQDTKFLYQKIGGMSSSTC